MIPLSRRQNGEEEALMWSKHLLLGFIGLASGSAVAAGTFAFLIMLGVVPRMVGKSRTAPEVFWYENAIVLGGILGNLASVFPRLHVPFGHLLLYVYGICAGIFVGCNAMALAEVLKTFPILFKRMKLKIGLIYAVTCMALGKTLGALWYFFRDMGI